MSLFSASGFTGVSMLNRPQENSTPAPISVTAATSPAVVPAAASPPPPGGGGVGATGRYALPVLYPYEQYKISLLGFKLPSVKSNLLPLYE